MNRGHSVDDAKRCLLALREAAPGLSLTTHALIGFPGEDERDFEDTRMFLKDIDFKGVQVYQYADRPNIPSALLPDKVPERVKVKRVRELRKQMSD
jgi:tRNA-2-methylthio-N6-dimethylallyladenosine synthase